MHAVRACRSGYVETIVDEESRHAAVEDGRCPRCQFVKHACGKRFFAYLEKRNLGCYARFYPTEYVGKLRIVRNCFGCRRAARYCVDNRKWKLERHCLRVCSGSRSVAGGRLPSD